MTGIVLAGGKSRRFGSEKGLVLFDGRPLVEYAIQTLKQICGTILISANTAAYEKFDCRIVYDEVKDIGPMGGIYSALRQSVTSNNMILSVDSPFISSSLLRYIYSKRENSMICVPCFGENKYEPLIGFYSKEVLPFMEKFINMGNYKLPDLFREVPFNGIIIPLESEFYHERLFYNVNTPEDLKRINSDRK